MSRHSFTCAGLGVALAALAAPALAHHSFAAEFDINQPVQLKGEVIKMVFTNPHSRIFLKVTTESGEVQEWSIEGGAPNALIRRGWHRGLAAPRHPRDGSRLSSARRLALGQRRLGHAARRLGAQRHGRRRRRPERAVAVRRSSGE